MQLVMRSLAKQGASILVFSADVREILEISDRVALLSHGKLRFVGTPAEFRASDDPVVHAFADRRAAAEAALQLVEEEEQETEEEP